jgi:SAM-dependent methyltransferase
MAELDWSAFQASFAFDAFPPNARVLDVGFGNAEQMLAARARGVHVTGVETDANLVAKAQAAGLDVRQAVAEALPFADASFDGIICKVVVPYTDEAVAIREWGRVMKPGAIALVAYHGAGYYLRYLLEGAHWKFRVYALRALVNTWLYGLSGRRLPGFVGDTLFQSEARLRRHYASAGLELEAFTPARRYASFPVFILHRLRRRESVPDAGRP